MCVTYLCTCDYVTLYVVQCPPKGWYYGAFPHFNLCMYVCVYVSAYVHTCTHTCTYVDYVHTYVC